MKVEAWIGLGSNLGDRKKWIEKALWEIARLPRVELLLCSRLIKTSPWGMTDQPWFLNGVAKVSTSLDLFSFFTLLRRVEEKLGRERRIPQGPRNIDLDLLFFGQVCLESSTVVVPHPRLTERYFTLRPLYELAPDFRHPLFQKTIRELWEEFLLTHKVGEAGWEIEVPRLSLSF